MTTEKGIDKEFYTTIGFGCMMSGVSIAMTLLFAHSCGFVISDNYTACWLFMLIATLSIGGMCALVLGTGGEKK